MSQLSENQQVSVSISVSTRACHFSLIARKLGSTPRQRVECNRKILFFLMPTTKIPIYGNYHGFVFLLFSFNHINNIVRYYIKRPFVTDERLALLPLNLFQGARVLDVGCNEGWVTCEIGRCIMVFSTSYRLIKTRQQHSLEVSISS
jgi:hypothetical protein